jgi:mRNA-degrading endonuclease RelE of RelBE toxin-antitoxin system
MKIIFEKRFFKDVEIVNEIILRLHKKIKTHEAAYRIRIGNYRLGFFYEHHEVIFSRILHRKDIYKYFP